MGYKITVNHSELTNTANEIDSYIQKTENNMNNANGLVAGMMSSWNGEDAIAYKSKWDTITNGDSSYTRMKKSLEKYSNYLKDASNKYKNAQANAINRANCLPRW